MTNLQGNIKKSLGNLYGLRTWIEYAFRQDKQELGGQGIGWKNALNNLRLIIQPTILLWLISPWLDIFPNHY
jgi:hypothetical protein